MTDEQTKHPLVAWAENQPKWQQHALKLLCIYGSADKIPDEGTKQFELILVKEAKGEEIVFDPIANSDLSSATGINEGAPKTYLKSLGPVSNIDKLASNQDAFEFAYPNGVTVIFGHNGSGKSGYARILKNLCHSRGEVKSIIGDATSNNANNPWQVNLTYATKPVNRDEDRTTLQWKKDEASKAKSDSEYTPLTRIAFFDRDVENVYVDGERDLFYYPFELHLYSELVKIADGINKKIKTKTIELDKPLQILQELTEGTNAYNIISQLANAPITVQGREALESIYNWTDNEQQELNKLNHKKMRTPENQKASVKSAEKISNTLENNFEKLSASNLKQFLYSYQQYQAKKNLAEAGVKGLAKGMPIEDSIGSETWQEMFNAARKFAADIYDEEIEIPIANGDYCVLCQQDLHDNARDRLKKFDKFMDGELQNQANIAKESYSKFKSDILLLSMPDLEATQQQLQLYAEMSDSNQRQVQEITKDVEILCLRFNKVKAIIEKEHLDELQTIINEEFNFKSDMPFLKDHFSKEIARLENLIQSGATSLSAEEQNRLSELEDKRICAYRKTDIEKYFEQQGKIALLKKCQSNSNLITKQSKNREGDILSTTLEDNYDNEIRELHLEYLNVSIKKIGSKGQIKSTPKINNLEQGHKKSDILSEGEQRSLALAGFLTEVNEINSGHAIIFDDPVSSLDWLRKGRIAKRLVKEARKRQVIIFTHDFAFTRQLEKYVIENNNSNAEIHFEQLWIASKIIGSATQFGLTGEHAVAWESKTVEARLTEIKTKIAAIESDPFGLGDNLSDIAGKLRETWERAIEEVAFNRTIERFYLEVRRKNLSKVYFNWAEHYKTVDEEMTRLNYNAHDGAESGGSISPTLSELKERCQVLERWVEQLKQDSKNQQQQENASEGGT